MKPYKIVKNVTSSADVVKETEVNIDTTFVNRGITKAYDEDGSHIGYNIAIQEWWWNEEYIEKISQENEILKIELANTNMQNALLFNEQSKQVDLKIANVTMETAMLLSQFKGGEI